MSETVASLHRFKVLAERTLRYPRIEGIYILEAAAVPVSAKSHAERHTFLRSFASPYGFSGPDVSEVEWTNAEVFKEEARDHLVAALVGGAQIGHSRWDVPPDEAQSIADEFVCLFDDGARFFCDTYPTATAGAFAPFARADFYNYIFGGGCVANDADFAAVFWMLDSD